MRIAYTVRMSERARTVRLAVYPDARVVVTMPLAPGRTGGQARFFGSGAIERFVAKHSGWVEKQLAKTKGKTVVPLKRADVAILKKRALALASVRCRHFAGLYGFTYKKISIRAQKSRWGSCSREGNLSFNYKLAVLSPELADYIIVHEVCHLREMNHSKKFWALVAQSIPEHKKLRTELRNMVFTHS